MTINTIPLAEKQDVTLRFPSRLEERALTIGADNLMDLVSWIYRDAPEVLRKARKRYRKFCAAMLREVEQPGT